MNNKIKILVMALVSVIGFNVLTDNVNAENKVSLYDSIKSKSVLDNKASKFVTSSTGINFALPASTTNGKGVYTIASTKNSTYPINYYRGDVTDNNVLFGDSCWKIVRTTQTGGTKLVFNGPAKDGKCSNIASEDKVLGSTTNYNYGTLPFSGYMVNTEVSAGKITTGSGATDNVGYIYGNDVEYGNGKYTLKDTYQSEVDISAELENITSGHHYTCLSTEDNCQEVYYIYSRKSMRGQVIYEYLKLSNGQTLDDIINQLKEQKNDSSLKEEVDNWYNENMTKYASFIENEAWCDDSTTTSLAGLDKDGNALLDITYNSSTRVNNGTPSLACQKENIITSTVGLLTSDEVMYAGYTSDGTFEDNYLDVPGKYWWTMNSAAWKKPEGAFLPDFLNIPFVVTSIGIKEGTVSSYQKFRPSIVLNNKTVIVKGNGTEDSPYELALAEENNEKAIVNPNTKDFILSRLIMYTLFLGTALIAMVVIKSKKKELN
ncbi:MAG: hypothetical protein E7160_00855 [Firmicutes bacterium]|nr:hypothetical protein [Bacillota bacterium]